MTAALVVDRKGLANKLGGRPKSFVLYELIQNAWDAQGVSMVTVLIERHSRGECRITVEDDSPRGFTDLASVYTMFRNSEKAADVEKRGRFELGEKLIAALATRLDVYTTKGAVVIEGDRRVHLRAQRERGTQVVAYLKLTRDEVDQLVQDGRRLLAPPGITTSINAEPLAPRVPKTTFKATLGTIRANASGTLVPTTRLTEVHVHETRDGETGYLYEMGIPVVEVGDRYHYDVQQRVPVSWERDNVPPAYLKRLRVEALNALHGELPEGDATLPWVADALDHPDCAPEAVRDVVRQRFGDKVVIHDPSDPEGSKMALSQGYTVIHGGSFSRGAWNHIREHGIVLPAGKVTPSPKPYSPEGEPETLIPASAWTTAMHTRAEFCKDLFERLVDNEHLRVDIVDEPRVAWSANFGRSSGGWRLCLNHGHLGDAWFERPVLDRLVLELLLHEFGHYYSLDHLSAEYHEGLCRLGARLGAAAIRDPEFFAYS